MEFMSGALPKAVVGGGLAVVALAACSDIEQQPPEAAYVHVKAGTAVYDVTKGLDRPCGEVAADTDVVPDHDVYGKQPLGTWGRRVAFAAGSLPLKPEDTCDGSFWYIIGGNASPIPSQAPTPAAS